MELKDAYPVIVLIGGDILERQAATTSSAIETLAKVAEEMSALVICGGTDMGVMAEIGVMRKQKGDLAGEPRQKLITVIPGNAEERVYDAIRAAISGVDQSEPTSNLGTAA